MKYVVEISPQGCGKVFQEHGEVTTDATILFKKPKDVALVVFTGGEDVWPELYGENAGLYTFYSVQRDLYEGRMFEQAQNFNIPCVGICRGSQFLCVKAGGKLVQDISGHGGCLHDLRTIDGKLVESNSSHHQMQLPADDALVLAWSDNRRSNRYLNGDGEDMDIKKEVEVVYYPNINALGIQGHPEWLNEKHEFVKYSQEIVTKYLFGNTAMLQCA